MKGKIGMKEQMLKLKEKIKNVSDILIVTHLSPDGDALGSASAVKMYVNKLGKKADLFVSEEVSPKFESVASYFEVKAKTDKVYELVIYVDCAEKDRADVEFPTPDFTCTIDHHISNPMGCDLNIVDGHAPAAGEIVYELYKNTDVSLDNEVAKAIYLAILTDTGGFVYEGTRKRTLEIVSELYDYDFCRTQIVTQTMLKKSMTYNKLFAFVMENAVVLNNEATVCLIDNDMYEKREILSTDTDGLSNALKDIEGIKCGILLTEREKGYIKGSIRTDAPIDATKIAALFGGGGHVRAAGFRTNKKYEEIKEEINGWLLTCK